MPTVDLSVAGPQSGRFHQGQRVRMKRNPAKRGIVTGIFFDAQRHMSVRVFLGDTEPWLSCEEVEPAASFASRPVTRDELLRELALAKLRQDSSAFHDNLYSVGASRTEYAPYQFRPVLRFLRAWQEYEKRGILIADEVGLGKTIEAAMILQELKARTNIERILILCPSKLTQKWQDELRLRFNETFDIWSSDSVRRLLRYEFIPPFRAIASLEMLRREDLFTILHDPRLRLDYLVIDESHHLRNSETRTFKLGELLADKADAVVLLSATPVHTRNDNLRALLQLVDPAEFNDPDRFRALLEPNRFINAAVRLVGQGDVRSALATLRKVEQTALRQRFLRDPRYRETLQELQHCAHGLTPDAKARLQRKISELNTFSTVINRTRKREFKDIAQREPITISIRYSPEERELYDAIDRHVRAQLRQVRDKVTGFATVMRERQAASCLPIMADVLREIADGAEGPAWEQTEFDPIDLPQDGESTTPGFYRHASLEGLICQARSLRRDTKYDEVVQHLRRILAEEPGRKVLLFSYFKRSLDYLYRRLRADGITCSVIHGGVPMSERIERIELFRTSPESQVLLSSEVGAEGLDFQFCDALINYDLPWNPMQIEQRIGRLDRFGREPDKKIRILNVYIENTIETRILQRLHERIGNFRESIGDLEEILGEIVTDITDAMLSPNLTQAQLEARARQAMDRIANERHEREELARMEDALLGQGDLLNADVDNLIEQGHTVSGSELLALVRTWLHEAYGRAVFEEDPEESVAAVDLSGRLGEDFDRFCQRKRFSPPTDSCLIQAKTARRRCPITFDAKIARDRRNIEFITAQHPLAQMAVAYWQEHQPADGTMPIATLEMVGDPAEAGDAWFFIYRVGISSVRDRQQLEVVVLSEATGRELPHATRQLFRAMQRQQVRDIRSDREEAEEWLDRAQHLMEERKRRILQEEQEHFVARASALVASLRATTEAKIARIQASLANVRDRNILRMRQAEIANKREEMERKIREIEARTTVSVDYQPIAGGKLHILPNPAQGEHQSGPVDTGETG